MLGLLPPLLALEVLDRLQQRGCLLGAHVLLRIELRQAGRAAAGARLATRGGWLARVLAAGLTLPLALLATLLGPRLARLGITLGSLLPRLLRRVALAACFSRILLLLLVLFVEAAQRQLEVVFGRRVVGSQPQGAFIGGHRRGGVVRREPCVAEVVEGVRPLRPLGASRPLQQRHGRARRARGELTGAGVEGQLRVLPAELECLLEGARGRRVVAALPGAQAAGGALAWVVEPLGRQRERRRSDHQERRGALHRLTPLTQTSAAGRARRQGR